MSGCDTTLFISLAVSKFQNRLSSCFAARTLLLLILLRIQTINNSLKKILLQKHTTFQANSDSNANANVQKKSPSIMVMILCDGCLVEHCLNRFVLKCA